MTEYRLHGPPGCGKTYALANTWVPRAIDRFGAENVVICSLTRAAAAEIASRGTGVPKENIGTLHALCFRALGRPKIAEAHLEEWNEAEPALAIKGSSKAPSPENPYPEQAGSNRGDDLMARTQVLRHRRTPRSAWPSDCLHFQAAWDRWLEATEYQCFTGLIEEALESVDRAPGGPEVFIVDEAQDCSTLELALIRKWNRHASFAVMAGDGDQAIYQWRGASPKAFLGEKIPTEHNYHLHQSYRVPRAIHALASSWIAKASYRYAVNYEPRDEEGSIQRLNQITSKFPGELIGRLEQQEGTSMILAACGYTLKPMIRALKDAGIPFHNPYRKTHGGWNPLRGGAERLSSFLRPDPRAHDHSGLWTAEEIVAWMDLIKMDLAPFPRGAKTAARNLRAERAEKHQMDPIAATDGPRIFGPSGWRELQTIFEQGTALEWLQSKILPSKAKLTEYAFKVAASKGPKALARTPQLVVGTIHSTKGSEASSVALFPDLSMSGMREWVQPGDPQDGVVRLFYVGMTRAKRDLLILGRSGPCAVTL